MNPRVAISAVREPAPVSSALVPTVIPCAKAVTSLAREPARSSTAAIAASTPTDWSSGVVGAFAE